MTDTSQKLFLPTFDNGSMVAGPTVTMTSGRTLPPQGGGQVPNWRQRIARGQDCTTTFVATEQKCRYSPASVTIVQVFKNPSTPVYNRFIYGGMGYSGNPSTATISVSEADQAARIILMSRITKARRDLLGGEFLSGLKKTIPMVLNPSRVLAKALHAYVHGLQYDRLLVKALKRVKRYAGLPRKQALKEVTGILRGKYLETVFGWLPLVNDIEGGAIALTKTFSSVFPPRVAFSSKAGRETLISEPEQGIYNFTTALLYKTVVKKDTVLVIYRGHLGADVPGAQPSLAGSLGFWPRDFLPTVWECIPFSFVADYFANVQEIVNSYSFVTSDLQWLNKTVVLTRETAPTLRLLVAPLPGNTKSVDAWLNPGTLLMSAKSVDRRTVLLNTNVKFELQLPGTQQIINVAAVSGNFVSFIRRFLG